ncbi:MAG: hypothetical protein WC026_13065 [Hyphomicrobium sp.]|uniref:hypothetical protein n=1 Tax=Hyphomicrobium sp. TaxID=82 RepID=UPI00356AC34C
MQEKEIQPFDNEWRIMVEGIMENGGSLWVIERTDTNQFMIRDLDFTIDSRVSFFKPPEWKDKFPTLNQLPYGKILMFMAEDLYPTKELADKFAPKEILEGGCEHCRNGAIQIPIKLTEHKFKNRTL